MRPTALIADDEPLLRDALQQMLAQVWPELDVVAQARNGREAVEQYTLRKPDICFLDVHMPGISGVEAARQIGRRAHLVFVTAFDDYAVQAFAQGALDYLVKPVEAERLADTVARLQERLRVAAPAINTDLLLQQLVSQLQTKPSLPRLRWINAQSGQTLRMIPVDDIAYLKSDTKYTMVAWRDEAGQAAEALVRTSLKELTTQLDPDDFVQVHRSVIVNLKAISRVERGDNETATIHLRERKEVLPVSRNYLNVFRQM